MRTSSILLTSGLCGPRSVGAVWKIGVRVYAAGLDASGYACCAEVVPACAVAVAGAIITTAMSGVNSGQRAGTSGGQTRRQLAPVTHHLPNGTVHDHLDTAALEVDRWHGVQTGEHTLLASRDRVGFIVLRGSVRNHDGTLSTPPDANAIEDMSAQFGDRVWPVANQWSAQEISNMAGNIIRTANLDGIQMCSTVSDDTDADTFDMSWIFETLNRPYTEIPPPCGV